MLEHIWTDVWNYVISAIRSFIFKIKLTILTFVTFCFETVLLPYEVKVAVLYHLGNRAIHWYKFHNFSFIQSAKCQSQHLTTRPALDNQTTRNIRSINSALSLLYRLVSFGNNIQQTFHMECGSWPTNGNPAKGPFASCFGLLCLFFGGKFFVHVSKKLLYSKQLSFLVVTRKKREEFGSLFPFYFHLRSICQQVVD